MGLDDLDEVDLVDYGWTEGLEITLKDVVNVPAYRHEMLNEISAKIDDLGIDAVFAYLDDVNYLNGSVIVMGKSDNELYWIGGSDTSALLDFIKGSNKFYWLKSITDEQLGALMESKVLRYKVDDTSGHFCTKSENLNNISSLDDICRMSKDERSMEVKKLKGSKFKKLRNSIKKAIEHGLEFVELNLKNYDDAVAVVDLWYESIQDKIKQRGDNSDISQMKKYLKSINSDVLTHKCYGVRKNGELTGLNIFEIVGKSANLAYRATLPNSLHASEFVDLGGLIEMKNLGVERVEWGHSIGSGSGVSVELDRYKIKMGCEEYTRYKVGIFKKKYIRKTFTFDEDELLKNVFVPSKFKSREVCPFRVGISAALIITALSPVYMYLNRQYSIIVDRETEIGQIYEEASADIIQSVKEIDEYRKGIMELELKRDSILKNDESYIDRFNILRIESDINFLNMDIKFLSQRIDRDLARVETRLKPTLRYYNRRANRLL